MEERLRFVARLLDGEAMTDVCREFSIAKGAWADSPERSLQAAGALCQQLPEQIESLIVRLKAEKPHWGARKIRELLIRRLDGDIKIPAKSTVENRMDGAAIRQFDRLFKTKGPGHNATPQIKAAQYAANGGVLAKRPQAVLKPKIQFNGVDGWADLRELHGRSSES